MLVPRWQDWLGGLVERHPRLAIGLGRLEDAMLEERLPKEASGAPIYVAGLARSGSTILLELLSGHPDLATHRYRDFPLVHAPWLWSRFYQRAAEDRTEARERAHGDGIAITAESPEAFEELLWMSFFPGLHDSGRDSRLDAESGNPAFESFYRAHLRKLLWLRGGRRYLAKGNYNLTRLGYLRKLFPDARFLVPLRDPYWHIASLMKQQRLFSAAERAEPRVRRYMRRSGHFEFGLDRRPPDLGDPAETAAIRDAWAAGREVEGWALAWAGLHRWLAETLAGDPDLAAAVLTVRHEDLCDRPRETFSALLRHCRLDDPGLSEEAARRLRRPTYYELPFSAGERDIIREIAGPVAARFGYAAPEGDLHEADAAPLVQAGGAT